MSFSIAVQTQDFDIGREYAELIAGDTAAGAVVFFVGRVRDMNHARDVKSMSLEHYPGMTENILLKILDEAKARWKLIAARIVHRVGELHVGDQIVFVGVTSAHREHAFQAAEFLMDFLKTQAPFWKKEHIGDSDYWVEEKEGDLKALQRWR
ncbi:MAG: molybdopterin synthase catalytic subunit MoaE [Cellvibrio sp.]|uniref:molybdopterin synthase catalytic subunit MoaE n=1 Tax=Cellvibrio sp. TaxID=1965322 RepID=UPI002728A673|nr:molybdopterin synthase catalytic subunit MoaE [Cellvibrio sp.]